MAARHEGGAEAGATSGPPRFELGEEARASAAGAIAGGLALALFTAIGGIARALGVPLPW